MTPRSQRETAWWRDAVIYQIYVRSFAHGNGDGVGVGDLAGVRAKLPHLRALGVGRALVQPVVSVADGRLRL